MPSPYSVIFCGTSAFALPSLEALMNHPSFTVSLVLTQPDRPAGREKKLTPPPVKTAAESFELPIFQPQKLNAEFDSYIETMQIPRPDFLVVVSFGQILSQKVLDFPLVAPINVHASLLPEWRGASPIQQAILSGQSSTGVTIQKMARELDAGPILGQQAMQLTEETTVEGLHDELAELGANLLIETLLLPLEPREQDSAEATFCRKLTREDGIVDSKAMTAAEIHRRVRALVPWPGVVMTIDNQPIKILKTSLVETAESAALPCADATVLYLQEMQPASKKPMTGKAWLAGRKTV